MYKLMIVEDEPVIRSGLKQYFDWKELGVASLFTKSATTASALPSIKKSGKPTLFSKRPRIYPNEGSNK